MYIQNICGKLMKKSISIIGAGVAGLFAGCHGQINGYNTQIFEMHNLPGGVCTSWKRKGYTIDGCAHWVTGTRPGTRFYRLWEELNLVKDWSMVDHEEYSRIEGKDDEVFIVYSDIDRLEQHMKDFAPEDKDVIEDFIKAIHKSKDFPIPWEKAPELLTPIDRLKIIFSMFPYASLFRKWGRKTIQDITERFRNPFMREVFPYLFNLQNPPDFPILAVLMTLSWVDQKTAGYPIGGSLEFAKAIERRYIDLGGKIHYKSKVSKIPVENDTAVGIKLTNGNEHRSDIVISAADGHTTIFDMLEGKYINKKIKGYYDNFTLYRPLVYVSLGIASSFEDVPQTVTGIDFPLDEPIIVGGKEERRMSVQFYNFDPTLAPAGKTFVRVMYASDYEYWKTLKQNPDQYKAEKKQIVNDVIASLDKRFPGLAAKVEMSNIATATTWERYTGNWKGSFQGWQETTKTLRMRLKKTLPGLKNFYMVGQWVEPGGSLPKVAISGRNVIQIICHKDKKEFITLTP